MTLTMTDLFCGAGGYAIGLAAQSEGYCPIDAVFSTEATLTKLTPTTLTDGTPAGWCMTCQLAWHLVDGLLMFTATDSLERQAIVPVTETDPEFVAQGAVYWLRVSPELWAERDTLRWPPGITLTGHTMGERTPIVLVQVHDPDAPTDLQDHEVEWTVRLRTDDVVELLDRRAVRGGT